MISTNMNQASSLLKQVIIKIDFTSIPDYAEYCRFERNNPKLQTYFRSFREIKANNIDVEASDEQINSLKLNDTVTICRFAGSRGELDQDCSYDLTPTFICLNIHCDDNYKSIKPYIDFMVAAISRIVGYESFTRITRIGIRKIDVGDYKDYKDGNTIFKTLNVDISDDERKRYLLQKNTVEHFLDRDDSVELISKRLFIPLMDKKLFRFVLDTDVFLSDRAIEKEPQDIIQYIEKQLYILNERAYRNFEENVNLELVKHRDNE